ncbi:unnamed protein product [Clavelina lepadiformis]|uniref:Piwi n=1 Tax=Clavelina lepadiformis TaxID=159417 RepID=A0ABP0GQT3_CLALP
MDPNDDKPLPGIGRGGRGVLIQKLLKSKGSGFSSSSLQPKPGLLSGLGRDLTKLPEPLKAAVAVCGTSGTLVEKPTTPSTGRGQIFSQLLKGAGRGNIVPAARGRGVFLGMGKNTGDSSKEMAPEKPARISSPTSPPVTSQLPGIDRSKEEEQRGSATASLATSLEQLEVKKESRKVIEYHGSSGKPIPIAVNCVKVRCKNEAIYQYHVSFSPALDSKNMRYGMLNQQKEVIGHTKAFDGTILYLPKRLPQNETKLKSKRFTDDATIEVCIRLTHVVDPASHQLIPFYNTVLRRAMQAMKMCPVGRNYYDPCRPKKLDKLRLNLWPGYVTAIKTFEGGLLLNIDVSHKVLRNDTARHVMEDVFQKTPSSFKEMCMRELVGAVVLTRYNNKNYRVDDIAWDLSPTSSFTNSKGESITFQEYYRIQYKIEIQDLLQPMLVHRPKQSTQRAQREREGKDIEICLVPELCYLTGLSDKLRNDFRAMKDIKEHTCLPPADRNAVIEQFLTRVEKTPAAKEELLKWGLELDLTTTVTNGRNFPPEKIMVGRQQVFSCAPNADFTKEVTRSPVIRAVNIQNWLLFFTRRDANKAKQFYQKMIEVSGKFGMRLGQPQFVELNDDRSTTYKEAISSSINPHVQLVVAIFPTSRDDRYNTLKRLCCVDMPVPSQVILSRTLPDDPKMGKFRSVTMKIALQVNCKLGGELWAVDIPLKGLMVCGIDVYHDAGGKGKSVAALVASTSRLMTRWYSRAILQQPHQEVIDGLKHCFTESIKKFYEANQALPERIVIYRDGVGDGQLRHVSEYEMPQLESCFHMFDNIHGQTYSPKLSVVVVSKRINIRYFVVQNRAMGNPPPGTVLDHTATRANWHDFFLISQHVRQGTVSPSHYIVVGGHEHLKADHMQRLSYKMTHMYYNWPGTVRVPAPCQYAHKLAYLVGQNIRQEPSLELCDRLFYL